MPYFSYGFPHAYRLPGLSLSPPGERGPGSSSERGGEEGDGEGGERGGLVASVWLDAPGTSVTMTASRKSASVSSAPSSASALDPSSSVLVLVTSGSVQVWNGGQNRYLMGAWYAASGCRILHAVVAEDGYVGVVVGGVSGACDVVVVTYVKKPGLKALAWAESLGKQYDGEGVLVEEVEVGEVWRERLVDNGDSDGRGADDAVGMPPSSVAGMVAVAGSKAFWVVRRDGYCVGYDRVRGVRVGGPVRCVGASEGGEVVQVGVHNDVQARDVIVPFVMRWRNGREAVGLVPWSAVEAAGDVRGEVRVSMVALAPSDFPLDAASLASRASLPSLASLSLASPSPSSSITCVAVCPRGVRVAIGLSSGTVLLQSVSGDGSDVKRVVLSLEEWGFSAADVGAVSALAWSPDGKVVAAGYARQGVSAWTTQGCRLFCTLVTQSAMSPLNSPRLMIVGSSGNGGRLGSAGSRPSSSLSSSSSSSLSSGVADHPPKYRSNDAQYRHRKRGVSSSLSSSNPYDAISHLAFSSHGSHLIIHSRSHPRIFLEVAFARCFDNHAILERQTVSPAVSSAVSAVTALTATTAVSPPTAFSFLIGADRLLLIMSNQRIQHVGVPQQYLESAYPIRTASLNVLQQDLAVAGVHGLAVYNVPSSKWRLIGDISQDKALIVRHLGWVHSDVIAVCAEVRQTRRGRMGKKNALGANGFKLLFFPKGHLDASSLLGAHDLPEELGMPRVMDVSNGCISLVFEGGEVHVLRYRCVGEHDDDDDDDEDGDDGVDGDVVDVVDEGGLSAVYAVKLDLEYSFDIPQLRRSGSRDNGDASVEGSKSTGPSACVQTLKAMSLMQKADGGKWCVLLWESGELGCIDLNEQRFSVLARDIEYYWIPEGGLGDRAGAHGARHARTSSIYSTASTSPSEDPEHCSTWWWSYGRNGMSLWLDDRCETSPSALPLSATATKTLPATTAGVPATPTSPASPTSPTSPTADPELCFDCEVLPIGVSLEDMSIIGLMHRTHKRRGQYDNSALSIDFAPSAERQPVLACLLRRLLLNDRFEDALKLADAYSSAPNFARSMEWLLYTSLEASVDDPSPGSPGSNSQLSKTADLVSNFSQFSQLVVAVARKVDVTLWPMLFEAAGSPSNFCEGSIRDGALDQAAACLLIVHDVVGPSEAARLAIKTLKSALATSKYRLCAELVFFLGDTAEIAEANTGNERGGEGERVGNGNAESGYVSWLLSWIAPVGAGGAERAGRAPRGVNGLRESATKAGQSKPPDDRSLTGRLHAAVASSSSSTSTSSPPIIAPLAEAWKLLAKHAWHILDDGNIRELASMDKAMTGVHGGLAALLQTTKHLHACSLGHITPSSSLIANALFIAGNEMTSASAAELDFLPGLMQSLLAAGCVNYALALAIVSNDALVMRDFAENNKDTWDRLSLLVSNDVHLCSFASVVAAGGLAAGGGSTLSLSRSATL